jgi:hypothetical protein
MKYIVKPMERGKWLCHCTNCTSNCSGDCGSDCNSHCSSNHPCNVCNTECGCIII